MAEMMNEIPATKTLSWSETWIKAVSEPSEDTYSTIVNDPEASPRKAYLWIFLTALIGYVIVTLLSVALGTSMFGAQGSGAFAGALGAVLCGGPVVGVFSVAGLAIGAGIIQAIAKMLGGEGTTKQLVYGMASYMAPISLVSSVLSAIPFVKYLSIPLSIYGLVLNVMAVKATNKFSWGKAIGASLGILLLVVIIALLVVMILALLGPAIGNVFSGMQ